MLGLPRNLHFEVYKVLRLPRNLHFVTLKCWTCHEINLHFEVHNMLRLPRNLRQEIFTSRSTKCCTCHETRNRPTWSQSHDSPHLSRNQSASKITTISKALGLPRNLHFSAPITCACHEKSLDHQNTRFPLRLPRKKEPSCPKMRTAPQRELSRDKRTLQPPRLCEPAQSKCASKISRGMNVL